MKYQGDKTDVTALVKYAKSLENLIDNLCIAMEDEAEYFETAYGPHMGMSGNFVSQRLRTLIKRARAVP